jgi:hypothetical protein
MALSGANAGKAYGERSVFIPENLLREARCQRGLGDEPVPDVCVLDLDAGDDFDKGEADGTYRILDVVDAIAKRLRP